MSINAMNLTAAPAAAGYRGRWADTISAVEKPTCSAQQPEVDANESDSAT